MLVEILTKEKKDQEGFSKLLLNNTLDLVSKDFNVVQYIDGEMEISGRQLRSKIVPRNKIPTKKKSPKQLEVAEDMQYEPSSSPTDTDEDV